MTNNEMLMAAIEFEEAELAADLYYLIAHGIINGEDEFTLQGNDWNKVDRGISGEYIRNNLLGINTISIYCVRIEVDSYEIFFARNIEEARGYTLNKFGFIPKIIEMDKSRYLKEFWFEESNSYRSLMDIRRESDVFPRLAIII